MIENFISRSTRIRPSNRPVRHFGAPPMRHWLPIGADEFVTMDADRPYVGEHTPLVKLSSSESHGIQQAGLAVRKGRSYTGRVVLAGAPGTTVKVTLIWGNGRR